MRLIAKESFATQSFEKGELGGKPEDVLVPAGGTRRFQLPGSIIQPTLNTLNVPGIKYLDQRRHVLFGVEAIIFSIAMAAPSLHLACVPLTASNSQPVAAETCSMP